MYKRLTEYDGHVAVTKGRHIDVSMLIDRLAAYEDTEWTPEEIKAVQAAISPIPFERYCEIMQAERDGRLAVLDDKLAISMCAGARAIETNINRMGKVYVYDVYKGEPNIAYLEAARVLREAAERAIDKVVGE